MSWGVWPDDQRVLNGERVECVDYWVPPARAERMRRKMSHEMPFSAKIPASFCVGIMICRGLLIRYRQVKSKLL